MIMNGIFSMQIIDSFYASKNEKGPFIKATAFDGFSNTFFDSSIFI